MLFQFFYQSYNVTLKISFFRFPKQGITKHHQYFHLIWRIWRLDIMLLHKIDYLYRFDIFDFRWIECKYICLVVCQMATN